ncbi:predicted protein [Arabidopsis lyrata subsp. lyrata]|uniref:Predicted protein n=1 Tax=Arabidopsis lyrata subsp. lyrata TaxID=81972 RepID=D7MV92_ARALL|nr:predicted protein [Arabidopsis lyrata subsp. lyrata]
MIKQGGGRGRDTCRWWRHYDIRRSTSGHGSVWRRHSNVSHCPSVGKTLSDHSFKLAGSKQVGGRSETTCFLWEVHDDFSTISCPSCLHTYLVPNLVDDMFDRRPHTDSMSITRPSWVEHTSAACRSRVVPNVS